MTCSEPIYNTCPYGHAHCNILDKHEHYATINVQTGIGHNVTIIYYADGRVEKIVA